MGETPPRWWTDTETIDAIDHYATTGELPHGGDRLMWLVRCADGQQHRMGLRRVHDGDWRQAEARALYYAWHGHEPPLD